MEYISIKETAEKWKVSERHVRRYCTEGKVKGAVMKDKTWLIPKDASKPSAKSQTNIPIRKEVPLTSLAKRIQYEHKKNNHFGIYEYIQVNLTYSSNRMASNRLTREQVVDLFRTNKVSVSFEPMKVDDVIETINHFACVRFMVEQITAPLTQEFIKRLHKMLYYGTYADRKKEVRLGEYRKEQKNRGIHPGFIKQEMTTLIAKYENTQTVTFETLLDFHVRFEEIHPFDDGNGRVGRLILMKECLRFGIEPFIIDDKRRGCYNQGIAEWPKDHTLLTGVCLEAQERLTEKQELLSLMNYCRPANGRGSR